MFVKTVDNRAARPGLGLNWTLAAYEADVARTHKALVGCQRGWDRYLDAHLGVMVDSSLDLSTAVLRIFRDEGDRKDRQKARLMWLIEEYGIPEFRERLVKELVMR